MSASAVSNRGNLILSAGLMAFGSIGMWSASRIHSDVAVDPIGPRAYPMTLFALFTIVSVMLFVRNSLTWMAGPRKSSMAGVAYPASEPPAAADADASSTGSGAAPGQLWNVLESPLVRVMAFLGAVFVYAHFLQSAGYLLSTTLLLAAVLLLLGARPLKTVAVAVGLTATLYAFFKLGLSVPLPRGGIF